ncbi:MAG: hypothetical protein A2341_07140 [Deltaproteobacteria bacterium RIFOXYB12_FULL_58_9]|nr:MAG: hypothetical protein A2341_07140 [Deltaproteobacteria bacterium RIFOXYB12_FULL_58_9]
MGLRLKLGIYVVGFVFLVLVLVGFYQVRVERQIYLREMENRGRTLLMSFAIPCAIAMANNDIPTLDNYVVRFADTSQSMDVRFIAALDTTGKVLAHTTPGEFARVYGDPFTLRALESKDPVVEIDETGEEVLLRIAVPVVSGLRWGTLEAGIMLANLEQSIAKNRTRSLITSVATSVAVALIVYLLLSFLVIRPVVAMAEMAKRFGDGDLGARVRLHSSDEMGHLALQLNCMGQQLQNYTDSLERLVQERTTELADANVRLLEANRQLDRLAKTDPLTGLYNRRHFIDQLEFEIRRGARTSRKFTLIILDVDHFKQYNDNNGHTAGDELLQRLATLLQLNLRSIDLVARYGGEEFVVLLLDTGVEQGLATAGKLQQVVAAQPFPFEASQPNGKLTISVGAAFYPSDSREARVLIEYADQALYAAKAAGRNTVKCWTEVGRSSKAT